MFRRFMRNRYGLDQLGLVLLGAAVCLSLLNSLIYFFLRSSLIYLIFSLSGYALVAFALYRVLSRNHFARQAENRKWISFWMRLRDRSNCYFRCPQCKQRVRVPRHKGKINIRCPKCGNHFIRKT